MSAFHFSRSFKFLFLLFFSGAPVLAQNSEQEWKMPEADSQAWVLRLKKLYRAYDWTVTAKGNNIIMQRSKPVMFREYIFNAPLDGKVHESPRSEGIYRITLQFAPAISLNKYEKLVAENEANEIEDRKLQRKHGISKRYGKIFSFTDEAKKREEKYLKESKKLVSRWLPHFYAPGYSITYYHSWSWFQYLDSGDANVDEECNEVEENVIKYFGTYNYLVAIGNSSFGYQEKREKSRASK